MSLAPVISSDWEATSGNKWTVPVGGSIGRVLKIGKQAVNLKVGTFYNVVKPNDATDWNFQFELTFLFPKK